MSSHVQAHDTRICVLYNISVSRMLRLSYVGCENIVDIIIRIVEGLFAEALFLHNAGDITEFPADYFWTSGNDLQIEGQWTWRQQKQTNIVVTNWKNGKAPVSTSKISDKNCIAVQQSASYQWVNHKCSKILPYVCETR